MQQAPSNPDALGRGLALATQAPRLRLLDQLRQAFRSRDGIRTIQDLLAHQDVSTTMIYNHVLKKGGRRVQSPIDAL